jgi:type IX secretion system PorP/SprF family membrane protein
MKKTITTIALGLLFLGAQAQQDAAFSMYFFNPVYVNPAYAGSREVFSGTLVHRSQWIGMPGGPTSQSLSIHSAIPNSRIGLGLLAYNDQLGPMKNTGVNLTFAYHLPINQKIKLSFGMSGMVNNVRIEMSQINIEDNNDNAFAGNAASSWVPDANAGLYLYSQKFYCGLSTTHLIESKFALTNVVGADQAKFFRQYYFTTGVVLPLSKNVDFKPSALIKYVKAAPAVGEVDGAFIFCQKFLIGAGYRTGKRINMTGTDNMLIGIVQFQISKFLRVGYSYDYFLNRNGSYNSGTHEIMLGWDVSGVKTKMSSPRFF